MVSDVNFICGDFTWPAPTPATERWRYETVKASQAALRESVSHLDPRAKVKIGFKQSRDALVRALHNILNEFAFVDQDGTAVIEKLVKRACLTWFQFQVQHCRIIVEMPISHGNEEDEKKMTLLQQKKLVVISRPALKLYGDEQGQDLHVSVYVGGQPESANVS